MGLPVAEQGDGEEEDGSDHEECQEEDKSEVRRTELMVRTRAGQSWSRCFGLEGERDSQTTAELQQREGCCGDAGFNYI